MGSEGFPFEVFKDREVGGLCLTKKSNTSLSDKMLIPSIIVERNSRKNSFKGY